MHDFEGLSTPALVIIMRKKFRDGKSLWAEGHKNNHYKEPLISGDQLRTGPILTRCELRFFSIARVNKWRKITWPRDQSKFMTGGGGEGAGRTEGGGQSSPTEFKGGNYRKLTA